MCGTLDNLKLQFVKEMYEDNSSLIQKISSNYTLLLHPINLKELKKGVKNELDSMLKTYVPEFHGILMSYDEVKVLSPFGLLFDTNPFVHITLYADFYVFTPTIGSILRGKVVKKSPNHVGCLVHGIFNVSSFIPRDIRRDEWDGKDANEGDSVEVKITKLDLMSIVPYLIGDIVPDSILHATSNLNEGAINARIALNEDDSGISSIEKSYDDELSNKNKKKKKKLERERERNATIAIKEEAESEDIESPKKKRKKKNIYNEDLSEPGIYEPDTKEEIMPKKTKKKKGEKNTIASIKKEIIDSWCMPNSPPSKNSKKRKRNSSGETETVMSKKKKKK